MVGSEPIVSVFVLLMCFFLYILLLILNAFSADVVARTRERKLLDYDIMRKCVCVCVHACMCVCMWLEDCF